MKSLFIENKKNKGFTIAELLVSMGIFVIVISISTTIFIKALRAQRAIVAYVEVNDALQLSIEQMAREIRTGKGFDNIDDDRTTYASGDLLHFKSAQEGMESGGFVDVYYKLEDEGIVRYIEGARHLSITPNVVDISSAKFEINNNPNLITIRITAKPGDDILQGNYEINIQTSVSPRGISL